MHKPWNGQTEDHYDSMVTRIKHIDGSWTFDYAVFDRYVEFMMNDVGINRLIACYTMIPWDLRFDYYDEATNRMKFVKGKARRQCLHRILGHIPARLCPSSAPEGMV